MSDKDSENYIDVMRNPPNGLVPQASPNERDPRFKTMLERIQRFDAREILANDAEELQAHLDLYGIPREIDGVRLTLVERMQRATAPRLTDHRVDITPTQFRAMELQLEDLEASHMCLDKAGVPRQQQGSVLSLWGRIVMYGDMRSGNLTSI